MYISMSVCLPYITLQSLISFNQIKNKPKYSHQPVISYSLISIAFLSILIHSLIITYPGSLKQLNYSLIRILHLLIFT